MLVVVVFGTARAARHPTAGAERRSLRGDGARANDSARSRSAPSAAASSIATGATSRSRSSARRCTPTRRSSPTRRSYAVEAGAGRRRRRSRRSTTRLADKSRRFVYIARTVDDAIASRRCSDLGLAGRRRSCRSPLRQYPAGSVASTIIGHVGTEGTGSTASKRCYDTQLKGTPGEIVVERDQRGRDIPDTERTQHRGAPRYRPRAHASTRRCSTKSSSSLVDQVTATAAKGGMAVIVDVQTGDVLAMATVNGATSGEPAHARARRRGDEPPAHRPVRAGIDEQAHHDRAPRSSTARSGRTPSSTCPRRISVGDGEVVQRHAPRERHRALVDDRHPARVVERRHDHDRAESSVKRRARAALRELRARPADRDRLSRASRTGCCSIPTKYYTTGLASSAIGYGVAVTAMQMVDVYTTIRERRRHACRRGSLDATIDEHGDRHADRAHAGPAGDLRRRPRQTMTPDARRSRAQRHRRVRGDPRLHGRGQDRDSRKAAPQGGYTDRDDGVVRRVRAGARTRGSRRSSCSTNPPTSTDRSQPRRCSRRSCRRR